MHGFPRLLAPAAVAGVLLSSTVLAGEPERIELGRRLFMDPTVSRGARFSCASCHDPEHGFGDARVLSADENGPTARHSQTLLDLKDGIGIHWDGEFFRVRELLLSRLATTAEVRTQAVELAKRHFTAAKGDGDRQALAQRLQENAPPCGLDPTVTWAAPVARRLDEEGRYADAFRMAFGSPGVTTGRLVDAIEAYVLSLRSGTSAYDRYVAGDEDALSIPARRGLDLFRGKAGCASCHAGQRFTDDRFHNTGVSIVAGNVVDGGLGDRTFLAKDHARFKTPTLRDVARRAPYMHDGSFPTLRDVVVYYDGGAAKSDGLDPRFRRLHLEPYERDDLVAFLESLTSDERPGLGKARARPGETRVRIEDLEGRPVEGLAVRVVPFGDRLGGEGAPGAVTSVTDRNGWIRFPFPDWTHVKLEAKGLSLGEGQPLPDCLREARLIAAPVGKTAVRVTSPNSLPYRLQATADGIGEVAFTRVRVLRRHEALYVAEKDLERTAVLTFEELPRRAVPRRYAVDFGAGFTQAIDLRADPETPVATLRTRNAP